MVTKRIILFLFSVLSIGADAQMMLAKKRPAFPLYSTLPTTDLIILDATGLVNNADNAYGQVTSGVLQVWKPIAPGTTGASHNFTADVIGTDGTKSPLKYQDGGIEFPGQTVLTNTAGATSYFEYQSNVVTFSNLKWTAHFCLKIGEDDIPNWFYGIFGNNGSSQGSRGSSVFYEDRPTRSDGLTSTVTKGSAGFIIVGTPDNLITPNQPFVLTIENDGAAAAGSRQSYYINKTLFAYTVSSPSTATSGPPAYLMQIGATGNEVSPFRGWMSHAVFHSGLASGAVRDAFIDSLNPYTRKTTNYFYQVDESRVYSVYNTLADAGQYYFVQGLTQDPLEPNKILKIFHDGTEHLLHAGKKVSYQVSTDKGRTWATKADAFDPDGAGDYSIQDGMWSYSSDGMVHGLVDYHSVAVPGTHKLAYIQSTDDLASTTVTEITADVPADGLPNLRAHGNIVEAEGYLFATLYKINSGGANSSNYLMRKPVGSGTTWTFFEVRAPGTAHINEMSMSYLGNGTLLIVARSEDTKEWYQWRVTSITGTPSITTDGDLTLGESLTVAGPPLLTQTKINGVDVVGIFILRKEAADKRVQAVWGTAENLRTNGISGWDMDTKYTVTTDTQYLHYGRICYYKNTFNSIAAWARDPGTLTENTLVTTQMPSTPFFLVKTELGL